MHTRLAESLIRRSSASYRTILVKRAWFKNYKLLNAAVTGWKETSSYCKISGFCVESETIFWKVLYYLFILVLVYISPSKIAYVINPQSHCTCKQGNLSNPDRKLPQNISHHRSFTQQCHAHLVDTKYSNIRCCKKATERQAIDVVISGSFKKW